MNLSTAKPERTSTTGVAQETAVIYEEPPVLASAVVVAVALAVALAGALTVRMLEGCGIDLH